MSVETQTISTNTASISSTTSSATPSESGTSPAITSDFETFLLMLTTQLENQDPLNPIESQDFAVQLATFSGVEQQVLTNDLLENLTGALGASDLGQLAGWVGMEARVTAPVAFSGSPVDVSIEADPGADQLELAVRNSQGQVVSREDVPLTSDTFAWVGQDTYGQPLNPGTYSLELTSKRQGEVIGTKQVAHYARVTEARQGPNGTDLVIAGGEVVSADAVTALRDIE